MNSDPRMRYFEELTHNEQVAALVRMHAEGASILALAHCSQWSIEYIERVLRGMAPRTLGPRRR